MGETVSDMLQPDLIGVEHRTAAPDRETVSVDPDDVYIAGPLGDALVEDLRPLADHRIDQPLDDFLVANLATFDPVPGRRLHDQPLDFRIGTAGAGALLVDIEAAAGLLAEAAHLAQGIGDVRLAAIGRRAHLLADAPADIETGEVAHGERPHRKAEAGDRLVDLLRRRALEQQTLGFERAGAQHAIADEAEADADDNRHLLDLAPDIDRGRQHLRRRLRAAHDLQQLHHVRRAEEMRTEHGARPLRHVRDSVDVEIGGIGGQNRRRLGDLVELREDLLLDIHFLEHRLDDEVGVRDVVHIGAAGQQAHALLDVGLGHPAAGHRDVVVLLDRPEAAIQRLLRGLDDGDRDAGIGEVHRNAAAHGSGTDDGDLLDRARFRALRHVEHLGGLALGEEQVALRLRLIAGHELHERIALALQAFLERQLERQLHRLDAGVRRLEPARPRGQLGGRLVERRRIGLDVGQLVVAIADANRFLAFGTDLFRQHNGRLRQVSGGDLVDRAELQGFLSGNRISADDDLQGLDRADEARQALRAAGTGKDAELHLRKSDPRAGRRDAMMTAERDLEAASEHGAVQRGDDRLRHRLDGIDHLDQGRRLRRLAEFRDVGAGRKGAACASQHDRLDVRLVAQRCHRVENALAHRMAQGVDRRIVDRHDGDVAVPGYAYDVAHQSLH